MSVRLSFGAVRPERGLGFAHGLPSGGLGRHGPAIRGIEGIAQEQVPGAFASGVAASPRLRPFLIGNGCAGPPERLGGVVSSSADEAPDQGRTLASGLMPGPVFGTGPVAGPAS